MKTLRGVVVLAVLAAGLAVAPGAALAATGAIEGRVTEWGTGQPIEGVTVFVGGSPSAVTGADGTYRIDGISDMAIYKIFFDHPDEAYTDAYYPNVANWGDATRITIVPNETLTGIDADLQLEHIIVGRIRDEQTGQPVEGICAEAVNELTTGQSGISNADGWVSIDYAGSDVSGTGVLLTDCNDLGYADEWFPDSPALGNGGGDDVFQPSDAPHSYIPTMGRFDALVGLAGSITGTVGDGVGNPIADACVTIKAPGAGTLNTWLQTDTSGTYELAGLATHTEYEVLYKDCGWPIEFAAGSIADVAVAADTATTVPIVMASTASVSGTVVSAATGLPVEGLCVSIPSVAGLKPVTGDAYTDALGRYSIQVADAENHWALLNGCHYFLDDRYTTQWFDGVEDFAAATELGLAPNEVRTGVDFVVDALPTIAGTLTRSDGGPAVGDACIRAMLVDDSGPSRFTCVDDYGHYELTAISPGSYNVYFSGRYRGEYYDDVADRGEAAVLDLAYNESLILDAELEPAGSISGQILPNAGVSFGQACVYLTDLAGNPVMTTGTDPAPPFYSFDDVLVGDYLLYAEDCDRTNPGFTPQWWRSAATHDGAELLTVGQTSATEVDIWVNAYPDELASVSGSILKDGAPWDACVTAYDENWQSIGSAIAGDGTYTIPDLELFGPQAAIYVGAADCGGGDEAWFGGGDQADATALPYGAGIAVEDIDISLGVAPEAHRLTVSVLNLLGVPVGGVCVEIAGGGVELTETSDVDGTVQFALAEAGTYDVSAGATGIGCLTGYTADDAQVTITEDTSIELALGLEVPPFTDAADSLFVEDIQWLAAAGVTRGCNPPANDRFCPDSVVTRGQMAAFLVRALGLSDDGLIDFIDDDGSMFEEDIERLAAAGITRGCNPPANDRFCPEAVVTRGQMAAFLVRALELTDVGSGDFVDDDGSIFEMDIEHLAAAGVTRGCNPPANDRFCPDLVVTRGQMAAFLHRSLAS